MNIAELEKKICRFSQDHKLFKKGDKALLAVSGGPDSVALTFLLNKLKDKLAIDLALFHLDHLIRKDSAKDTEFVKKIAAQLSLPFYSQKADVKSYAAQTGKSLQEAGREVRYKALQETAAKIRAGKIATGHQANDQIETFFLRLLRGAALTGLQAIPVTRGNIVRPLLNTSRDEITGYLKKIKQPFITDPSNVKPVYLRNRIRSELVPVLQNLNPSFIEVLSKNMGLIIEEEQFLDTLAKDISKSLLQLKDGLISIDRLQFQSLAVTARRRLLRLAICNLKGNLTGIEQRHIQLIIDNAVRFAFLLQLPSNLLAYVDYKDLKIGFGQAFKPEKITEATLQIGKSLIIKPLNSTLESKMVSECQGSNLVACLDFDKIKPPLTIRGRRPGDKFQPLGIKGSKKLQDFFVDKKVPKFSRDSVVIVSDTEKIIWVAGCRIDERAKIDSKTKSILKLSLR